MVKNSILSQQAQKIYDLIIECESKFEEDDELRSHMAKYICILCSGFLENAMYLIYTDWVSTKSPHVHIEAYVQHMLNKVQNPNSDKFREIVRAFNLEWEPALKDFLQEEERASAINYIIKDRHKIAHGKNSDITLLGIKAHFDKAIEVVDFIESQLAIV
ncbi:hypothetical protein EXU85_20920 [Spirosoma sp. KCTC 42546]|uniref:HEPN domain-containing protein n=1 Tax=Spirosoma sp. KCTC 42546 TaxID=2520506 RepID=UPI00115ABD36|nr:HEPN domain-containing protein [Spirosoma sp. KCTC 42546]QDK80944.1 hypothetical protein EXU85_20920 [Spirosoma sp. KCTC 42546]